MKIVCIKHKTHVDNIQTYRHAADLFVQTLLDVRKKFEETVSTELQKGVPIVVKKKAVLEFNQ